MRNTSGSFFKLFALVTVAATAVFGSAATAAARQPFGLVEAFKGTTYGVGSFSAPLFGINRPVRTTLTGVTKGRRLTVYEKIDFADGERQRKTWYFTRVSSSEWVGRRSDVVGTARAVERDGQVVLTYDAKVSSSALGETVLSFYDLIYRRADGRIINETVVSKFGIPVGSVTLTFRR